MNGRERGRNVKFGVDPDLEAEADEILAAGRRGTTKHSEMRDYLSEGQLYTRMKREVYTNSGTPEIHLFSGLTKRAYAPPRSGRPRGMREE